MGYTKREFIKLLGITTAMLPFIGCYDLASDDKKKETANGNAIGLDTSKNELEEIKVTSADLIILEKDDQKFEQFNQGFNKRINKSPKYIAICKTEKGVQFAIKKAVSENLKVTIKSGGHSFEGFSSNNGGMVLNLSLMKSILWLDDGIVELGSGWLLQEIQDVFSPKKRLLPAGSCGTVGIAGLTLGGGYGFFSREFGLTCDSLLQVKMIGADGKIHNSDDDPSLLWACKGGGNGNFGAITSFRFQTYDLPPTFSSYVLKYRNLDENRFEFLLQNWFEVSAKLPLEAFSAFVLNGKTLTILVTNYKVSPSFEESIAQLINEADSFNPSRNQEITKAMKRYYGRKGPIYFKNASGGMFQGIQDLDNIKSELFQKVIAQPGIIFQINTLGGAINKSSFQENNCFPHRHLPYLSELQAYWDKPNQEQKYIAAFDDIQNLLKENGVNAHYRNYPDLQFKDWENSYYGASYKRLQELKRKYDPKDVFQYEQSIRLA